MAIRFRCPACKQPIEVDDHDANRSVRCFYCHAVIQTPAENDPTLIDITLSESQPTSATPASTQFEHIGQSGSCGCGCGSHQHAGQYAAAPVRRTKTPGVIALVLTILTLFAAHSLIKQVMPLLPKGLTDVNPTTMSADAQEKFIAEQRDAINAKIMDMQKNEPEKVQKIGLTAMFVILAGLTGTILTIYALAANRGRGYAIAAIVLGIVPLLPSFIR